MKYCTYCGTKLSEADNFCPSCGARVERDGYTASYEPSLAESIFEDRRAHLSERSVGTAVISFIFPIIGLIIWVLQHREAPGKAMSAAKGAIASISFNSPLVGLIIHLIMKSKNAELSKTAGVSATVGMIVIFAFVLLYSVTGVEGEYIGDYYDFSSLFSLL